MNPHTDITRKIDGASAVSGISVIGIPNKVRTDLCGISFACYLIKILIVTWIVGAGWVSTGRIAGYEYRMCGITEQFIGAGEIKRIG